MSTPCYKCKRGGNSGQFSVWNLNSVHPPLSQDTYTLRVMSHNSRRLLIWIYIFRAARREGSKKWEIKIGARSEAEDWRTIAMTECSFSLLNPSLYLYKCLLFDCQARILRNIWAGEHLKASHWECFNNSEARCERLEGKEVSICAPYCGSA